MSTVLGETIGAVRVLTLNRPEKLNAANLDMQETLLAELRAAAADDQLRALILSGAGRAFSAGGDRAILEEMAASGRSADHDALGRVHIDTIVTMLELPFPAIAAVNGFAVGYAAGLVALCDMAVMGTSAFLCDPHVRYGIAATSAAQMIWPLRCSELLAREILMTGRNVGAAEALRIGLANRVCADGEERATALEMAQEFVALPPGGIAETKRAFNAPLLAEAAKIALVER
ncbi:MAG: enoyl-CoA hydratase/isomerase family protein [Novosphingobium sp.]